MVKTAKKDALLEEVIDRITPSPEEAAETQEATNRTIDGIRKLLKGLPVKVVVAGSGKKHTQLKNTGEIDLFVLFNYKKYSDRHETIPDILGNRLRGRFKKLSRLHGSRDYFQAKLPPYVFEIVPILEIRSSAQAKNITDVTPLHAKWVSKNSKGKLGQIRLTKAFLKTLGIYGAESYIHGFSGYACEILTIHYGSFIKLLVAAARWKDKQIIDPAGFYRRKNPLMEMNKSKLAGPLVLVDPVQSGRNVTASLNHESFTKFRNAASKFLKRPSAKFFERKKVTEKDLAASLDGKHSLLVLRIVPEKNKKDAMGAAILDKYLRLRKGLSEHRFRVKKSSWFWDEKHATVWFIISKKLPPPRDTRKGPRVSDTANSLRFRRKHKNAFVKRGRLYAHENRRFISPPKLVRFIVNRPEFRKRLKTVKTRWHQNQSRSS